jgi:pyruvate ferredoxin oxidoreductase gamma subunit
MVSLPLTLHMMTTSTTLTSVRIIGRGGQGVKSAARVLGTAAFLAGLYVQDQPLYGAERRGAPITAFIRISNEPILERGHLSSPSFLVVIDDSLLNDSTMAPLRDISKDTIIILINTNRTIKQLHSEYFIQNPILLVAIDNLADLISGNLPMIGIAAAAVVCKVLGYEFDTLKQALEVELGKIRVHGEELRKNINFARLGYDSVKSNMVISVPGATKSDTTRAEPLCINLEYHDPKISSCIILSPGNTNTRRVGDWTKFKPIIDYDKCTKCMICFVYCPDSAISIDVNTKYPVVDYGACKGCNICFTECPTKAITMGKKEGEETKL